MPNHNGVAHPPPRVPLRKTALPRLNAQKLGTIREDDEEEDEALAALPLVLLDPQAPPEPPDEWIRARIVRGARASVASNKQSKVLLVVVWGAQGLESDPSRIRLWAMQTMARSHFLATGARGEVCVVLGVCGSYFDRGTARLRLDRFLHFFERYLLVRQQVQGHG